MNKHILPLLVAALTLAAQDATAQLARPGPAPRGGGLLGGGPGPKFDPGFRKLFGENKAWTAGMEIQMTGQGGGAMTIPAALAMLDGKSRMDMDLTKIQGAGMPPGAAEQVKAMGMAEIATINRPDKKAVWFLYPGLEAYVEMPLPEGADKGEDKFKLEVTEQGKETINGQPCTRSKFVVTDDDGKKQEGIVWQATNLKNFPLRLQTQDGGQTVTMTLKDVKLAAPAAALFEAPAKFKRYENQQVMMQEAMMKRFGGGAGGIPPVPPSPK